MTLGKIRPWWGVIVSAPLFVSGAFAVSRQGPPPPPPLGGPLPGLSSSELQDFESGRGHFIESEGPLDGLGPVFNGVSCVQCHHAAAVGGASADLTISRVTRIGALRNGVYSDLTELGGPLLQARSLKEFLPNYPVRGEVVPPGAQFVAHRITTPLFGAGLIEAIPDDSILALSRLQQPDGIRGVPNMVVNAETGNTEVGRFGWKAQVSNLHVFAADAYLNEMGITNQLFQHENLPQGKAIPPGADIVPDPEDQGADVDGLANYMRYLAPPPPPRQNNPRGEQLFDSLHCASCHTPVQHTGFSTVAALSNKDVHLFSDLLLHRMGPGLADNIRQGQAMGDQFKTAPLWGVGRRPFWLHDGRARTLDQAIRLHGGEAAQAAQRYSRLLPNDRQTFMQFLMGL
jgi:CxxC motif-containing protein (DUF1111 family)